MTEADALTIAEQFMERRSIKVLSVERVFFVPATAYETRPTWLHDEWVVHFRIPPRPGTDREEIMSRDQTLIVVRVDVESQEASAL